MHPVDWDQDTQRVQANLRTALTVALRAGQLLLEAGADTQRVEETMHSIGTALGASAMEVYVTPTGIIGSALSGPEHRTRIVRVRTIGVDLSRIDAINRLSRRAAHNNLTPDEVNAALDAIAKQPRRYNRFVTVAMTGLACACLSQIFGGGWPEFVAVFVSAAASLVVRQELTARGAGLLLQVPPAAFIATVVVWLVGALVGMERFPIAVPSAVLYLVPGVPLITSLNDLLGNFLISGVARAAQAALIVIEIGVGVALAVALLRAVGLHVCCCCGRYCWPWAQPAALRYCSTRPRVCCCFVPQSAVRRFLHDRCWRPLACRSTWRRCLDLCWWRCWQNGGRGATGCPRWCSR